MTCMRNSKNLAADCPFHGFIAFWKIRFDRPIFRKKNEKPKMKKECI